MRNLRKAFSSSSTPTNNPPDTPAPPIAEYIKQQLAVFLPGKKDRTLVASSSAIAVSTGIGTLPQSSDLTDPVPDEPESSRESAWRAAYGAAKIAVDIAKDSSDILPPLKAVMVALSVLIKNYDQAIANADQLRGIEERVQSLGEILKYPVDDGDGDEKARRETLKRKLAGIIAKLKPLEEQHAILKFLKNTDYANTLNDFVQDLACAVTDYQTSLQQSIHENTRMIDESTKRVDATTNAINETTNRIEEAANKIDKKIDESAKNIIEAAELELLGKLEPVRNAGYQAGHHDTCLRGTRESVLDWIIRWAEDPQERHVFWLNGLAGTGKSTISQTISEIAANTRMLGASFFCSRDYLNRKELKNIFPTLAYQLACRYPTFRSHIIQVIKQDPSVAQNSLISQLKDLIVDPLISTNISCVIVVDALDECVDDQPASAILSVLGRHAEQLQSTRFFITGRPEPRIRTGFRLPLMEPLTQIFLLHEVKPTSVDEDIRLYLQEKLTAVAKQRSNFNVSDPWPCGKDLVALTKKSSGLFIFASTLVRFIESAHHDPNERLQLIVTPPDNTTHEGRAGIDPLYTQVLTLAFSEVKEDTVFLNFRRVLGVVILAFNPLSREQIAAILGIDPFLVTTTLRHLHSVLLVPSEDSKEIRVFHKSFPDFLQDRNRCSDPRFFIDSPTHHGDIALGCLELLNQLKANPCDLPDFVMNRDVADLPELLEDKVGSAMRYACDHWAMHVRSSPTTNDYAIRLISSTTEFFKKNAIPWIEVMSLENRLESVIHSIYNLFDWLGMVTVPGSDLRRLAEDCLRFTMNFFHPIQQSASHLYHSALPLSPRSSTFHSRTLDEKTEIAQFDGRPEAWGIVMRTITAGSSKHFVCMTTFGRKIAAACDDGTVGIYDSVTGVLRLSLNLTGPVQAVRGSPDGSVLFCAHKAPSVTVWDIQTGGLIHTLDLESNAEDIAVSLEGRYLACRLSDGSVKAWEVVNKMEGGVIWTSSPVTHICWLEPEEQIAVSMGGLAHIRNITSGTVLYKYELLHPVHSMVYSQKFDQLAIVATSASKSSIMVINPQTGTSTTHCQVSRKISCFAFSQTTQELVFGAEEENGLWRFHIPRQRLEGIEYPDKMTSLSCLSNGTVVANSVGSSIQLLSLAGGHVPSRQPTASALAVQALDQDRIVAFFPGSRNTNYMILFEPVAMLQLHKIPVLETNLGSTHRTVILCASREHLVAVHYFQERNRGFLQSWRFREGVPKWTVEVEGLPKIGRISPTAVRLVTIHTIGGLSRVFTWNARDGQLEGCMDDPSIPHPLEIEFTSDTEFDLHCDGVGISFTVGFREPGIRDLRTNGFLPARSQRKRYLEVDDAKEWVVRGSKRICWIPPGYLGSNQSSHCWIGCMLLMVGQDEGLRKLTFRAPC